VSSSSGDRRSAAVTTSMTTAATPEPFFAVVVDHTHKEFDVHGPMVDDMFLIAAVYEMQEAGCHVTLNTRAQRGPSETLEMASKVVGRELGMVHRPGLLRRLLVSNG
jgi:hypothetical protein